MNIKKKQILKLSTTLEKMDDPIDEIFEYLEPFLDSRNQELFIECVSDIHKIHEGTTLLKETFSRYFGENHVEELEKKTDLSEYLAQARHALRNPLNVVKGYTELVLEDFINTRKTYFSDQLIRIYPAIQQILTLIELIKIDELTAETSSKPSAESILFAVEQSNELFDSPEYMAFRDHFSILIVDDSPDNCHIVERQLKQLGFKQIKSVHSGREALELKDNYKLILLDIAMPGLSGIEVLKQLKEDILQRRLTVLMISAVDTLDNILDCIRLGAEDFLPKPFNADILQARIEACVERRWFFEQQGSYYEKLESERAHHEKLLESLFPRFVLPELITTGKIKGTLYKDAAIIWAEVVDFPSYCAPSALENIQKPLEDWSGLCEKVALKHKLDKIKTHQDAFLAVSGLSPQSENSVLTGIEFAQDLIAQAAQLSSHWQIRVSIGYGTFLGGLIGKQIHLYDILGEEVNAAMLIQKALPPNTLGLTKAAWETIQDLVKPTPPKTVQIEGYPPVIYHLFEQLLKI